jgi:hypothetical protein
MRNSLDILFNFLAETTKLGSNLFPDEHILSDLEFGLSVSKEEKILVSFGIPLIHQVQVLSVAI